MSLIPYAGHQKYNKCAENVRLDRRYDSIDIAQYDLSELIKKITYAKADLSKIRVKLKGVRRKVMTAELYLEDLENEGE